MNDSIRESDLLARYGGDEFVILTANTDLAGAQRLAEKIRTNVAESSFIIDESLRPTRSTLSMGVAEYRGTRKQLLQRRRPGPLPRQGPGQGLRGRRASYVGPSTGEARDRSRFEVGYASLQCALRALALAVNSGGADVFNTAPCGPGPGEARTTPLRSASPRCARPGWALARGSDRFQGPPRRRSATRLGGRAQPKSSESGVGRASHSARAHKDCGGSWKRRWLRATLRCAMTKIVGLSGASGPVRALWPRFWRASARW